jgi:rubrerythrin
MHWIFQSQGLKPTSKPLSGEKAWPIANTLFFADVAKQLGHNDLAKLFRETAAQETEHAFAHFRLLHPELVVGDAAKLSDDQKNAILKQCLNLAIEG